MRPERPSFEALATAARREMPPAGDVTAPTMSAIARRESYVQQWRPLIACTCGYGFVSLIALAALYTHYVTGSDPVGEFFALAVDASP